jgi:hypothetical protein
MPMAIGQVILMVSMINKQGYTGTKSKATGKVKQSSDSVGDKNNWLIE